MTDHPNPEKRRKLAELDALAREQDERAYLRDLDAAATAQLRQLGGRLLTSKHLRPLDRAIWRRAERPRAIS